MTPTSEDFERAGQIMRENETPLTRMALARAIVATALATARLEGRNKALDEAAQLIRGNAITYGATVELKPRREGDSHGFAYADAILALNETDHA